MAYKIFCDGCDKPIVDEKDGSRIGLEVKFNTRQGDEVLGQFACVQDLCKSCIDRMKELIQAKNWARSA